MSQSRRVKIVPISGVIPAPPTKEKAYWNWRLVTLPILWGGAMKGAMANSPLAGGLCPGESRCYDDKMSVHRNSIGIMYAYYTNGYKW